MQRVGRDMWTSESCVSERARAVIEGRAISDGDKEKRAEGLRVIVC